MKIGILTYYNAINYGAVLQAYALQETITAMGYDCEIINYASPAVEKQYRWQKLSEHPYWKLYLLQMISARRLDEKKRAFLEFRNQYLNLSKTVEKISDGLADCYDVIIVGSDQVFNPKNTEGDKSYLLDITGKAKKITYAASIGNNEFLNLWKSKYGIDYVNLLRKFNDMSFREKQATEYVSNLLQKEFKTVLDPVLLAGRKFWQQYVTEDEQDYIFVYNLSNSKCIFNAVRYFAERTGLDVITVNRDIKGDIFLHKYMNKSSISPQEFVHKLANAKYVITDSFHGTAFSVLLHKDFYSIVNTGNGNTNSRLYNLLTSVGLESRIITTDQSKFEVKEMPNYDDVDEKLEIMRKDSLDWLDKVLKK